MSSVRVIAVSQPLIEGMSTPDDIIAFTARVSNPNNQNNTETAPKLLKYLKKHKHWSPFEMATACLEINTTRDIARQILRHRSFSFQEFSQRYADVNALGNMFEKRECRLQDTKNRQNSTVLTDSVGDQKIGKLWEAHQKQVIKAMKNYYNAAIEMGVAKEQARAYLPEGLTKSRIYMSGSIRSWIHYCELRTGEETQKEHRIVAQQCWDVLLEHFPSLEE